MFNSDTLKFAVVVKISSRESTPQTNNKLTLIRS